MDISLNKKRRFIYWFLSNHQFNQREVVWLLQYVMKRDYLLKQIHFVYEAHLCPRSIILSTVTDEKRPFRFYKNHIVTTDVEKAFHDIRLNPEEAIYFECIYEDVRKSLMYASVLEDNPYLPDDYYLNNEDFTQLEKMLTKKTVQFEIKQLKRKIDTALDEGNEEDFLKYAEHLRHIQQKEK